MFQIGKNGNISTAINLQKKNQNYCIFLNLSSNQHYLSDKTTPCTNSPSLSSKIGKIT